MLISWISNILFRLLILLFLQTTINNIIRISFVTLLSTFWLIHKLKFTSASCWEVSVGFFFLKLLKLKAASSILLLLGDKVLWSLEELTYHYVFRWFYVFFARGWFPYGEGYVMRVFFFLYTSFLYFLDWLIAHWVVVLKSTYQIQSTL